MGIFPPWTYIYKSSRGYVEHPAGYSFIAAPPTPEWRISRTTIKIDTTRLLIQWAVTIAATGFGVILTAKRNNE